VIVRGPRSAADAWEDYARIDRWPTWSPHLTRVTCDESRIRPGLRGTVHSGLLHLPFVIKEVNEDAMTWTWRVLGITLHHWVMETPDGCLTGFRGPLPYLPIAWVALKRLVSARGQQPGHRVHG